MCESYVNMMVTEVPGQWAVYGHSLGNCSTNSLCPMHAIVLMAANIASYRFSPQSGAVQYSTVQKRA